MQYPDHLSEAIARGDNNLEAAGESSRSSDDSSAGACEVGSPMKVQRGVGKKSSGRYQMQYEEEYFYEEEAEGEDESDVRQRWPARSADGKFRVSAVITLTDI